MDVAGGNLILRQSSNAANTSVSFNTTVQNALTLDASGNLGIGTSSPTNILSLGGNSARTFWMERHTTANTAGNTLTIQSGGATSGATDKNGGSLLLQSGTATGTGSSVITFSTATAGTTGTTDRTVSEKMRIDGTGNTFNTQPAPAAVNASATLTVANLQARIITSTTAAAVTGTLPTGTLMDGWYAGATDMSVDWSVINTGATNTFTVAAGTGHTVVGNMVVAVSSTSLFRSRRTAANTWVTYRVG
jgi:hypothetical protein